MRQVNDRRSECAGRSSVVHTEKGGRTPRMNIALGGLYNPHEASYSPGCSTSTPRSRYAPLPNLLDISEIRGAGRPLPRRLTPETDNGTVQKICASKVSRKRKSDKSPSLEIDSETLEVPNRDQPVRHFAVVFKKTSGVASQFTRKRSELNKNAADTGSRLSLRSWNRYRLETPSAESEDSVVEETWHTPQPVMTSNFSYFEPEDEDDEVVLLDE